MTGPKTPKKIENFEKFDEKNENFASKIENFEKFDEKNENFAFKIEKIDSETKILSKKEQEKERIQKNLALNKAEFNLIRKALHIFLSCL